MKKSIFKFRDFSDRSLDIFKKRELWFAKPNSLNDPFDCQLEYEDYLREALAYIGINDEIKLDYLGAKINSHLNDLGVCSFCKTRKNQLMWAHYAREHYGFCIGFDEKKLINNNSSISTMDVIYQSRLPFDELRNALYIYTQEEIDSGEVSEKNVVNAFAKTNIGTKYTNWKYERERRLILDKSGVLKFEPSCVNSVAFGLRMDEEHKIILREALSNPEWHHVRLFEAKKSTKYFGLEFQDITDKDM